VHHEVRNCGVQLLVESAFYARIGLSPLADNDCQIVLDCYSELSPIEDVVRARCRLAQGANQFGQYTRAKSILEGFDPEIYRTLHQNAYIHAHTSLLHLKHLLRQQDLTAAEHVLHALQASAPAEPDLQYQIEMMDIQYHIARKNLSTAADKIEDLIAAKGGEGDVVRQIGLLLVKAEVFAKGGHAGKGFTIVMRAAALAWKCRVLPLMWEAMGSLARILSFFGEDAHASKLMDAVLPQVSLLLGLMIGMTNKT
jgi:anaphase-promoting complex subunit 5